MGLARCTYKEVQASLMAYRERTLKKRMSRFSNLLEWLIVIWGWFCIATYIIQGYMRSGLIRSLSNVMEATSNDVPPDLQYTTGEAMKLHEAVQDYLSYTGGFRVLVAEFHLP